MTYGGVLRSLEDGEVVMLLGAIVEGIDADGDTIIETPCVVLVKGTDTYTEVGEVVIAGDSVERWEGMP